MDNKEIIIRAENNPAVFARCAAMMASTDPWVRLGMDEPTCAAAFEGQGREVYTVWVEDKLAGFVVLQMLGSFKGYVQTLLVADGYRGQGISLRLLQFCEAYISKVSANMFICVSAFNDRARRIYERYGFELVGVLKDFIKPGFDEWLLRKQIKRWERED